MAELLISSYILSEIQMLSQLWLAQALEVHLWEMLYGLSK